MEIVTRYQEYKNISDCKGLDCNDFTDGSSMWLVVIIVRNKIQPML